MADTQLWCYSKSFFTKDGGGRGEDGKQYYQKNILCANQNVDSFVVKEIISDNHSSQTKH